MGRSLFKNSNPVLILINPCRRLYDLHRLQPCSKNPLAYPYTDFQKSTVIHMNVHNFRMSILHTSVDNIQAGGYAIGTFFN